MFVSLHCSGLGKAAKGNHLRSTLLQISPCLHSGLVPAIGRAGYCLWRETECSKMAIHLFPSVLLRSVPSSSFLPPLFRSMIGDRTLPVLLNLYGVSQSAFVLLILPLVCF